MVELNDLDYRLLSYICDENGLKKKRDMAEHIKRGNGVLQNRLLKLEIAGFIKSRPRKRYGISPTESGIAVSKERSVHHPVREKKDV